MDRSKVLKAVSTCADFYCKECPYNHLESKEYPLKCIHTLMMDVRDLLGLKNITTLLCPCCETPMELTGGNSTFSYWHCKKCDKNSTFNVFIERFESEGCL